VDGQQSKLIWRAHRKSLVRRQFKYSRHPILTHRRGTRRYSTSPATTPKTMKEPNHTLPPRLALHFYSIHRSPILDSVEWLEANAPSSYLLGFQPTYHLPLLNHLFCFPHNPRTNCLVQSPSWKAHSYSVIKDIQRILWNQKVQYRVHNSSPPIGVFKGNPRPPILFIFLRSILILSSVYT
jgi:hypothetical protein